MAEKLLTVICHVCQMIQESTESCRMCDSDNLSPFEMHFDEEVKPPSDHDCFRCPCCGSIRHRFQLTEVAEGLQCGLWSSGEKCNGIVEPLKELVLAYLTLDRQSEF